MARRLQFRLRTLLIVVTLLAMPLGYVGWQARIVRERKAMMNRVYGMGCWVELAANVGWYPPEAKPDRAEIPWLRKCLGDEAVEAFTLPRATSQSDVDQIKAIFPGARIEWDSKAVAKL